MKITMKESRVNRYIVKILAGAIYYLAQENFLLEDIWKTQNLIIEKINWNNLITGPSATRNFVFTWKLQHVFTGNSHDIKNDQFNCDDEQEKEDVKPASFLSVIED